MTDHPGGEAFASIQYPPHGWHFIRPWGDGHSFVHRNGLRVLIDCAPKADGRRWVHVSFSRKNWVPSHQDACLVKQDFLGDRYAYAVFPPADRYVNIHQNCLHLWALAEGDTGSALPEFSAELEGIGLSV